MAAAPEPVRCAIYTRKSSDEGLEQNFNSLHAQREACEAYVASQKGEGWRLLQTVYDDGGFSGGDMDRPALKLLMADVEAGRLDTVVVYKVDRLTRSLADFAKMVERFDARGVTFVSVTQAFNTTTSMGRLTLNVLLSFAQFEREVTGERIRDKIKASKQKGMWMGGIAPLGYDPPLDKGQRALVVNEAEAERVRSLFRRYLELSSVQILRAELAAADVRSKQWTTRDGHLRGGEVFSRGALFHLLKNRVYLGEVTHRGEAYPGLHAAIVDPELFVAVRASLKAKAGKRAVRTTQVRESSPLTGFIFDAAGRPMSPTTAYGKGGRRYRYYVTTDLQQASMTPATSAVRRVPGPAVETLVASRLRELLADERLQWAQLRRWLVRIELKVASVQILVHHPAGDAEPLPLLLARLPAGDGLVREGDLLRLTASVRPVFRGGRTWLVTPDGSNGVQAGAGAGNTALATALWRAHRELAACHCGPTTADADLAQACSPADSYRRRLGALAFLAPDIQRALLDGRQSAGLTLQALLDCDLPLSWVEQRAKLGFPPRPQALAA